MAPQEVPGPRGGDDPTTAEGGAEGRPAPYQNLWVPLIVIPAAIVISIVLVFALFGLISGSEASLSDNLERVVGGGTNERTQALYNIARQVGENELARREGRDLPWPMEEGFGARVKEAMGRVDADDHEARLTLAMLLTTLGDPAAEEQLIELLQLGADQDEGGRMRFAAAVNLGNLGSERAREPLLALLESDDEGLRSVAALALQQVGGPGVEPALRGALQDPSLVVRGNAALGLARLVPDDADAAGVLLELLQRDTYSAENERDATRFTSARVVSESRIHAARALARMEVPGVRERLEELRDDDDIELREAILIALSDAEDGPRGGGDS